MTTPIIAGIDEAGRGALAGPVSAAACILPADTTPPAFICDSKALTPEKRELAFSWIQEHCHYGHAFIEPEVIDNEGILAANERAMQQAVANLATKQKPTYLLVDGRDKFWFDYPHSSVINGDAIEPCIGAASIVAKVLRDHFMQELNGKYPGYGLGSHKGYGSEEHCNAIRKLGPCEIHRKTFLKNILNTEAVL